MTYTTKLSKLALLSFTACAILTMPSPSGAQQYSPVITEQLKVLADKYDMKPEEMERYLEEVPVERHEEAIKVIDEAMNARMEAKHSVRARDLDRVDPQDEEAFERALINQSESYRKQLEAEAEALAGQAAGQQNSSDDELSDEDKKEIEEAREQGRKARENMPEAVEQYLREQEQEVGNILPGLEAEREQLILQRKKEAAALEKAQRDRDKHQDFVERETDPQMKKEEEKFIEGAQKYHQGIMDKAMKGHQKYMENYARAIENGEKAESAKQNAYKADLLKAQKNYEAELRQRVTETRRDQEAAIKSERLRQQLIKNKYR